MPSKDPLPSKENALFKKILKSYELKQYRQGLKLAKLILSNQKFAEHGETLAMKGLILNCVSRKEEAYDHVRRGLRNDLTSHVCWHVFGLLQRSDRKYDEAIKAYRNALRWDKDNLQIMRDLSLLQIQMRDYDGYRETRQRLLELRPGQKASWIGYAISWHLLKDYDMALAVIEEFRKTLNPKPHDYEYSELVMYQCSVLEEAQRYQDVLQHLLKYEDVIVDKLYIEETRARVYQLQGDLSNSAAIYRRLLERNAENTAYYQGLEKCLQFDSIDDRLRIYSEVLAEQPRASVPKKLPLTFATGEMFKTMVDEYLRRNLRKGVPSLFTSLKPLYADDSKVHIIEELVVTYHATLISNKLFHPQDTMESNGGELEPPSTLLWTEAYLAQHFDYLEDYTKALEHINRVADSTPTLPELFMIKGRIYKHAGNIHEAYKALEEAQSLDTADRYINCVCAKYMLRNNMVKEAEAMCQKFTREGVAAADNLNEMQCMWYQTECAGAYARKQEWGNALRQCHQIDKHFTEITEDQFDFHTYCLRKLTLRSYVSLLRLEDVLRNHRFYFKTASIAIRIYLHLHRNPVGDEHTGKDSNPDNLSASELKKLKNKQRKAQKKAAEEKAAAEEAAKRQAAADKANKSSSADSESDSSKKADDLVPSKLERCTDPLEQAIRFLVPLQTLCPDNIQSHIFAFEIYSRKDKPLLMLKAIKGGIALGSADPRFHVCLVRFLKYVRSSENLSDSVRQVLEREMRPIYGDDTPESMNSAFLEKHKSSLPHRLAGAQAMYHMDQSTQSAALKLACDLDNSLTGVTIQNCTEVYESLTRGDLGPCSDSIESYKQSCHQQFPLASIFTPPTSEPLCNGSVKVEPESSNRNEQ
ncbi:N-alpha-acetyltransferase 15, NatA auxiliary subunit-like [Watersipora subatra]|uniref:N-alpha-acetyltransferase 15, NatA auxiliary subunit-like n=1 Tax=Watersipora subatra TaxID=2589382 RepID=UPI00355B2F47